MKSKYKDLQFSVDQLRSMLKRDGLEPEQISALEDAAAELIGLGRKPNPSRREIFRVVRKVAEAVIRSIVS
jgi:hypothetical protein